MGMTNNQLGLVRAVAENRMQDARKYAIACCTEDTTKKNQSLCKKYKNMLMNPGEELKLPPNLSGIAHLENLSHYRADRYYLPSNQEEIWRQIEKMRSASMKLQELDIPYLNASLFIGDSGTGKTAFARYIAKKMDLPFLYINFAWLIDSYMGKTARNLQNVFAFANQNPCLLMLDEIDCIGTKRKMQTDGAAKEMANVTITLLQELDHLQNTCVLIAATNIPEQLDPALKRRFSHTYSFSNFDEKEKIAMVTQYLDTVPLTYQKEKMEAFVAENKLSVQGVLLSRLIEKIAEAVLEERGEIF